MTDGLPREAMEKAGTNALTDMLIGDGASFYDPDVVDHIFNAMLDASGHVLVPVDVVRRTIDMLRHSAEAFDFEWEDAAQAEADAATLAALLKAEEK